MVAPADMVSVQAGHAALEVRIVSGQSAVTSALAASPMKLLTPRARGTSVWACTSCFGGGLVAGDQTRLDIHLGSRARCFLGTQASTKVYRNPARLPSGHETRAILDTESLLVLAPDPLQAYAGSIYAQSQAFDLAPDASLVLLDWFSSGRAARGERWAFSHYSSRNEVHLREPESRAGVAPAAAATRPNGVASAAPGGRDARPAFGDADEAGSALVFLDSIRFDPGDGPFDSLHRPGRFNCLATLLLIGPLVRDRAAQLLADIAARPVERRAALVCSASPLRDGALLRVAGEQVERVARELHHHLAGLAPLLGDDPWARKW